VLRAYRGRFFPARMSSNRHPSWSSPYRSIKEDRTNSGGAMHQPGYSHGGQRQRTGFRDGAKVPFTVTLSNCTYP